MNCTHNWTVTSECPKCLREALDTALVSTEECERRESRAALVMKAAIDAAYEPEFEALRADREKALDEGNELRSRAERAEADLGVALADLEEARGIERTLQGFLDQHDKLFAENDATIATLRSELDDAIQWGQDRATGRAGAEGRARRARRAMTGPHTPEVIPHEHDEDMCSRGCPTETDAQLRARWAAYNARQTHDEQGLRELTRATEEAGGYAIEARDHALALAEKALEGVYRYAISEALAAIRKVKP